MSSLESCELMVSRVSKRSVSSRRNSVTVLRINRVILGSVLPAEIVSSQPNRSATRTAMPEPAMTASASFSARRRIALPTCAQSVESAVPAED
jgi:hypothetical protein